MRIGIPFILVAVLLAGCATSTSTSTAANKEIPVLYGPDVPKDYVIIGQVSGPTTSALQEQARKLGADAIIRPHSKDPVSGWATTDAIKIIKPEN